MPTPLSAPSKTMTLIPPLPKPTTPVTPQRAVSQCAPNLAGSVPQLNLLAATPVANTSSSNVQASNSTCVNISKPLMPRFMTPSSSQQTGQPATALQKTVTPTLITSHREPLFLPGTDDKEEQVQWDLVETGRADEEVASTNGEDGNVAIDNDEGTQSSDEATSPPPTKMARRLCQEPRILLALPTSQSQAPHQSAPLHVSPVNSTAAYLKAIQDPKPKAKKKRKEAKTRLWRLLSLINMRGMRMRIDNVEVCPTPVIWRCGPGPSKPPPVTLGVSGRGFGEKVPSTAEAVNHGIKSIGILKVDKNFGEFMEVDKSYWSKAVALFIGEWYTTAFKCMHCHYSKLPCKVNGIPALNPIKHYHPKGSDAVNTFEATVNAIEANNAAIATITQQYLAGLSVFAHTDNIHAQTFHLHRCLAPIEENEDDHNSEDEEYEAPDDVAEGVAGSSKKRKVKLG
ncbi:hypothetical protein ARMGADRAFT_1081946 [Armillaria gallica]|uniref:Uncharacterized protein n=1 Tax=Armillaria gallica TaxID=47427 RepID=A0A2H3D7G8_ARMGA|nr:hypothetical protein ARMGADRAFT_1081946 [Armillaria gallica]